ncbi:DJ-1/PfpI family protein [Arachidicoccus terrestris]|uniref:DJ-1/PfpI family protein n=1 Tax=Arachidicoccus terrestris TaxID=2875539 RepID=UPI001CC7FAA0|nr:DJ-1/PfpI family protein [Arachidicoccus terrestris]UAY55980.1 DJ-1/PfpI family protein [Arachidicoccus terrestris]
MKLGFLLYNGITALDLFGPLDIFGRVDTWEVELCACSKGKYDIGNSISLEPKTILNPSIKYDAFIIPGGVGQIEFCEHRTNLNLIKTICSNAEYILGVCTGSIILGFCGLLEGKKATTNKYCLSSIEQLGAISVDRRVVEDHNLFTCGGVTAGLDLALYFVKRIQGDRVAKKIQLSIEYSPEPLYSKLQLEDDKKLVLEMDLDKRNISDKRSEQINRFLKNI